MPTFAGKEWSSFEDLARIAAESPGDALETFRVVGHYGDVNPEHHQLKLTRSGGIGDVDEVGVMAYEDLLIDVMRCVGSDYLEYCAAAGVPVDAVRLEIEGKWDLRGSSRPFGIKVPARLKPGWQSITVRAEVMTDAPSAAVHKAHLAAWENNVAAASLAAVPTKHEVTVKPPMLSMPLRR